MTTFNDITPQHENLAEELAIAHGFSEDDGDLQDHLDDLVHDFVSQDELSDFAASVNNQGQHYQIAWLFAQGFSAECIKGSSL